MQTKHAPLYIRALCLILLVISFFLGYLVYVDSTHTNSSYNHHTIKTSQPALFDKANIQTALQPEPDIPTPKTSEPKTLTTSSVTPATIKNTPPKVQQNKPKQYEKTQTRLSEGDQTLNKGNPKIAIIIDDIGYAQTIGKQFIDMPYPLSYAFIPFSPYGKKLALHTHSLDKLVMLHAPMATVGNSIKWEDSLHPEMSNANITEMLTSMLNDIPHVKGVNNHGGSLFTQSIEKMPIVFNSLKKNALFFVDSRTSANTVGQHAAQITGVKFAQRDVFLDNSKDKKDIHLQIDKLIEAAKQQGYAIGIAHPYMETYAVLNERLSSLDLEGIKLVPANALVQ